MADLRSVILMDATVSITLWFELEIHMTFCPGRKVMIYTPLACSYIVMMQSYIDTCKELLKTGSVLKGFATSYNNKQ